MQNCLTASEISSTLQSGISMKQEIQGVDLHEYSIPQAITPLVKAYVQFLEFFLFFKLFLIYICA